MTKYIIDFIIEKLYDERISRIKQTIESNNKFISLFAKDLKMLIRKRKKMNDYINFIVSKDITVIETLKNIKLQVEEGGLLITTGLYNILIKNHYKATLNFIRTVNANKIIKRNKERELNQKYQIEKEIMQDPIFYDL